MKIKVHSVGSGVYANENESLHFTQNNDEKIVCLETEEVYEPNVFELVD